MKELLAIFIGVTLSLFAIGWIFATRKRSQGQLLLDYEPRRPVPWGFIHVFVFGILMIGIQSLLASYWGVDLKSEDVEVLGKSQQNMLIASGASRLLTVGLVFALIMVLNRGKLSDLGIVPRKLTQDVATGVVAFAMIAPIVFGMQVLLTKFFKSQHPLIEWLTERPTWMLLYLVAFSAVVVAPIAEEVLFRLLLQGWLEKVALMRINGKELVFGGIAEFYRESDDSSPVEDGDEITSAKESGNPYDSPRDTEPSKEDGDCRGTDGRLPRRLAMLPILGSATIFALMHYSHGPDPIPLFFLSIGIGYVYQRTHRILPCILIHMLLNGFSVLLLWMQLFGSK